MSLSNSTDFTGVQSGEVSLHLPIKKKCYLLFQVADHDCETVNSLLTLEDMVTQFLQPQGIPQLLQQCPNLLQIQKDD